MIDPFYLAAIPEPRTILGLRLRPLSLGHIILLHRLESAYVCGGKPDFSDLSLSILICASTYEEGLSHLDNPDLYSELRRWSRKLTGDDKWTVRLGFRKPKQIDFEEKHKAFSDYIADGSKLPNYHFNPSDFTQIACPSAQIVKVTLMREMKFTEPEMLNRSWALCLWDFVTLKAISGSIKMMDGDEVNEALNIANALRDKIEKGEVRCQS